MKQIFRLLDPHPFGVEAVSYCLVQECPDDIGCGIRIPVNRNKFRGSNHMLIQEPPEYFRITPDLSS